MTVEERILSIRIADYLKKHPIYADRVGIEVKEHINNVYPCEARGKEGFNGKKVW